MRERVAKRLPFARDGAVDQEHASARLDDIVETYVDAARPGDPVQFGVKRPESDEPQPEHRHGIAEQAEKADEMIGPAPPHRARRDARGDAERDADDRGYRREFERRGEEVHEIGEDRVGGHDRMTEIAGHDALQVEEILLRHRSIEPDFQANAIVGLLRRVIADDGQHRIDGDEPSDREGDRGQPEKGRDQGADKAQDPHESRVRLLSLARAAVAPPRRAVGHNCGALSRTARRMRDERGSLSG